MLDLAITGGTCVLPTGTQAADIGVKDGRIALVAGPGSLPEAAPISTLLFPDSASSITSSSRPENLLTASGSIPPTSSRVWESSLPATRADGP